MEIALSSCMQNGCDGCISVKMYENADYVLNSGCARFYSLALTVYSGLRHMARKAVKVLHRAVNVISTVLIARMCVLRI